MSELTTRKVDSIKPLAVEKRYSDGLGVYLRVMPSGAKSFVFRYVYANKRQLLNLGSYPELSLAAARDRALDARKMLEEGKNPQHHRQAERMALLDALTIKEAIGRYRIQWLDRHFAKPAEAERLLKKDLKPIFSTLVPDVTPLLVTTCVNKIVERGSLTTANRFLNLAKKFFQWTVDQHMRRDNPVTLTRKAAGGKEVPRKVNLRFEQLAAVYQLLAKPPLNHSRTMSWQTAAALQLMILTGQRPGEIVRIEWDELDLTNGIWVIPAKFTKVPANGDHTVHLSKQAIALLKDIKAREASKTHVFPTPKTEHQHLGKHLRRHSLSETMLSLQKAGIIEVSFTPHDLRRTFSSRMAELRQEPHVVEKILNHQMEGVMAVYNQYDYFPERRKALQVWGDAVERLSTDLLTGL